MAEASLPEALRGNRSQVGSVIDESDYLDYSRYYEEYDDEEEVEDYYFSSAAGRARVVIGNRRHGPNGFLSSGRIQARPSGATHQAKVTHFNHNHMLQTTCQNGDWQCGSKEQAEAVLCHCHRFYWCGIFKSDQSVPIR